MIHLSFFLMFVSCILWAFHDLYRDGNKRAIDIVNKIFGGWHVLKWPMIVMFFLSGVAGGIWLFGKTNVVVITFYFLAMICSHQAGFEGTYNLINHIAKPFDWIRYFISMIQWKNFKNMPIDFIAKMHYQTRFEFMLYHCFRVHWIEAVILFLFGFYLTWRL